MRRMAIRVSRSGRLDVYGQAGFEARDESSLETLQILGRYIGSNDNTLICLMQCIERMEELIQGGFLAAEELDIVNKQHINLSVSAVEFSNLTLALVRVLQRVNEFVREFLRRDVSNLQPGILDQCIVADGVQQVGFAQARSAIDTQRVEILPGTFGHGQCDRTGKTRLESPGTKESNVKFLLR